MFKFTTVGLTIVAGAVGGVIGAWWMNEPRAETGVEAVAITALAPSAVDTTAAAEADSSTVELRQVRLRVATLHAQLTTLRERLDRHVANEPTLDSEPAVAPMPKVDASPEEIATAVAQEFEFLEEARLSETRDAGWADNIEMEAQMRLEMEGSELERFECGSTLCQLVVRHEDAQLGERFRLLMGARTGPLFGGYRWRVEDGRTIAYFVKTGETFPSL